MKGIPAAKLNAGRMFLWLIVFVTIPLNLFAISEPRWVNATHQGISLNSENGEDVPVMTFAKRSESKLIELYFSSEVLMDGSEPIFSVNGMEVDLVEVAESGLKIYLDGSGLLTGEEWTLRVDQLFGADGQYSPSHTVIVVHPMKPGDLLINEIMYQPVADPHNGIPDQSEYIEIYNRRSYAISLSNVILHDQPDENGAVRRMVPSGAEKRWIAANGYAVIYPETENLKLSESRVGVYFNLPEEMNPHSLRMHRTTLSLPLGGRAIYLANDELNVSDHLHYRPEWHNPNLISVRGVALERISEDLPSNASSSWGSSASIDGGTPGSRNSLYQHPESVDERQGVITLSPNPFSPDADGFEDRLFINYQFDNPDYLLRVRIYDRYGRLVRNLAENHPAGFGGSLVWDGLMDDGTRNRIGIYIILMEAYNASTGSRRVYRERAVLA
ncbi:MAG: lamin tail domain-containing protein, partial [Balneolaceae bacterium]|nr:lamin tail domain-containing protein [Balneolaceae bacterium]